MRVVSLLPAATEWLAAFGAGGLLVGRSHACDYPPEVRALPALTRPFAPPAEDTAAAVDRAARASGGPALDLERLRGLSPDLVVAQDACGVCGVTAAELQDALPGVEVASFSPGTWKEVLDAALGLARRVGRLPEAMALLADGERELALLRQRLGARRDGSLAGGPAPRVACVEWTEPLMLAGHWVPDLVRQAGGEPVGPAPGERSPSLSWEALAELAPEVLFVAPCGRTLAQALRDLEALAAAPGWEALPAVRTGRVFVADGAAYFNSPGPRLYRAAALLAAALHPERAGVAPEPWELALWHAPVPA